MGEVSYEKENLLNASTDFLYTCTKLIMPLVESNVDTFYETLKGYDEDGQLYLSHVKTATEISDRDFYGNYYYEDNCGFFEEMNGYTMSEYYNDMYFGSIESSTTIGSYEKCTYSKSYKDTEEYKEYIKNIKTKTILSILTKNPALKNICL